MDYIKKYDILQKFIILDKKHWGRVMLGFMSTSYTNISNTTHEPYLAVYTLNWIMWQDLLKKYTHKQLSDYLIEVIRKDLPELKGSRLHIINIDGLKSILLNLPKNETNEFLYII